MRVNLTGEGGMHGLDPRLAVRKAEVVGKS